MVKNKNITMSHHEWCATSAGENETPRQNTAKGRRFKSRKPKFVPRRNVVLADLYKLEDGDFEKVISRYDKNQLGYLYSYWDEDEPEPPYDWREDAPSMFWDMEKQFLPRDEKEYRLIHWLCYQWYCQSLYDVTRIWRKYCVKNKSRRPPELSTLLTLSDNIE